MKSKGDKGSTGLMPVLFVGHGSPMNAIEDNEFTKGWHDTAQKMPKPTAVLCISAHWETRGTLFTAMKKPQTIHDVGGFPRPLYEVKYPAPGDPVLASEAKDLLAKSGAGLDERWGLDHGCWSVLKHLYPAADVPVIQMSLDYYKTPALHYELASELAPLRKKGVLIIGSGNLVHNLSLVAWDRMKDPEYGYDWAIEASEKIKGFISSGDYTPLINYSSQGQAMRMAVPTPDHFLPLLYILALKKENEKTALFNDKAVMGSVTMTSLLIGA